jgi:hypothetical protein
LDLTGGSAAGEKAFRKVRLRESIAFNIEPMPSMIKFKFDLDENQDQALLGDFYTVIVSYEPVEDITL